MILLSNGFIVDLLYGFNNEVIFDMGDVGWEYYIFWFYNSFELVVFILEYGKVWL